MTTIGAGGVAGDIPASDWVPILVGLALILGALLFLIARSVTSAEFRAGLTLGLRGLLGKELRSRSRGWRPMWLLTGYLAALTLAIAGLLALMGRAGGTISPTIGTWLFSALAVGSVLLLAFMTPALTVGSVSGERERRTLDLLLVTRASALGLVGGKLLGALFYVLFLLVASLPAFAVVYLFGGVPPLYLLMVVAVAVVTALAHASLGLLLSALVRRTIVATVLAYLMVIGLVFGVPFVSAVIGLASMSRSGGAPVLGVPPIYLYASPLVSLTSVLPAAMPGMSIDLVRVFLGGGISQLAVQQATVSMSRTVHVVAFNPITGQSETATTWAPWVYHFLLSGGFTLFCLFTAALALAPVKPWRAWQARRRRPAMSSG